MGRQLTLDQAADFAVLESFENLQKRVTNIVTRRYRTHKHMMSILETNRHTFYKRIRENSWSLEEMKILLTDYYNCINCWI